MENISQFQKKICAFSFIIASFESESANNPEATVLPREQYSQLMGRAEIPRIQLQIAIHTHVVANWLRIRV